ncbi:MAG: AraC family transcriptional regulator [Cyanobacteria bacterium]|nr:AraC family transcriptional regulator [Cyanobacteriota bacterium]
MRARTRKGQLRLAGLLHPFSWGAQAPLLNREAMAKQLAAPLGITTVRSPQPGEAGAHQLSLNRLGPHWIAAWVGTPFQIVAAQPQPTLILPRGGRLEWEHNGRWQRLDPGWLLVLNGGGAYQLRSGVCSLVAIGMEASRLEEKIRQLRAPCMDSEYWRRKLQRPLLIGPGRGGWDELGEGLNRLLALFEVLEGIDPRLATRLGLDASLEGLVAVLLLASASGREAVNLAEATGPMPERNSSFDELLSRIRSHLEEPLDLARLEGWAHTSRRSLQVVFQDRLGCTPMQWVRQERLNLALQRLKHPAQDDTVAGIASACGYSSPSRFSAEFRRQYRFPPSALLRNSRRQTQAGDVEPNDHEGSIHAEEDSSGSTPQAEVKGLSHR